MSEQTRAATGRCEICGSTNGYAWYKGRIRLRRYADGEYHEFCRSCLTQRSSEMQAKQAEAYRKRKATIKECGAFCQLCGKKTDQLHQHHVKRVVDGGGNHNDNLLLVCVPCHKKQHKNGFLG